MAVMTHKIHMGADLPSVQAGTPYMIIGNQQSVHDYSRDPVPAGHPQLHHLPHAGRRPRATSGTPTRPAQACGSCHDDIDWETGENHAAGPRPTTTACAFCHQPEGELEFDASVKGAHTIPTKSTQLEGLNMEILERHRRRPGRQADRDLPADQRRRHLRRPDRASTDCAS